MLHKDANIRINLEKIKKHNWVKKNEIPIKIQDFEKEIEEGLEEEAIRKKLEVLIMKKHMMKWLDQKKMKEEQEIRSMLEKINRAKEVGISGQTYLFKSYDESQNQNEEFEDSEREY